MMQRKAVRDKNMVLPAILKLSALLNLATYEQSSQMILVQEIEASATQVQTGFEVH